MGIKRNLLVGTASLLCAQGAYPVELTFIGGAGLEWTDNVYHAAEEKRNDLLETIRAGVRADEQASWYQLNITYDASHERYDRESYAAETYYNGAASVLLTPAPERFDWLFMVQSSTTLTNSALPNTPDNRDQRTIYSTTPRLVLLSSVRDTVSISGDASRSTFRNAENSDSDRAGGFLTWTHRLSQLTSLNTMGGHEKVNFEAANDYERDYYNLGFTRQLSQGSVSLAAGQTRLTPEQGDELTGANYNANFTWGDNIHTFMLDVTHDLTDTSTAFADGVNSTPGSAPANPSPGILPPTDVNTGEASIITRTRIALSDAYQINSTTRLYGMIYHDKEKSEVDASESNRTGGVLTAGRDLTPELSLELTGSYEVAEEGIEQVEDDTARVRLTLTKNFTEQLALAGWLGREEADSEFDERDYEVNSVGLSLTATF